MSRMPVGVSNETVVDRTILFLTPLLKICPRLNRIFSTAALDLVRDCSQRVAISGPISRNQKTLLRILSYHGMRSWRYCENGNRMPSACLRPSQKVWMAEERARFDGWKSP